MVVIIAFLLAVVFFVIGIAVLGFVAHLLWWLVAGVVIGALARLVLPGTQPIGILATALFGIAGSFIGAILAHALGWHSSIVQLVLSIGVAALLVAAVAGSAGGRALARQDLPGSKSSTRCSARSSSRSRVILDRRLVGVYLVGSFALGAGDEHADADFLVVTDGGLAPAVLDRLQALHAELHGREPWGPHLEGSYLPAGVLRAVDPGRTPVPFLDHGSSRLVPDPHCNTAVTRWTLREHGIVLAGPPPVALVDPVDPADLRAEARVTLGEIATWVRGLDGMNRWEQPYVVLSLCRVLRTLRDADVVSKARAGRWAMETFADPAEQELIRQALADRPDPVGRWSRPASADAVTSTLAFLAAVERRVASSASG